MSMDVDEAFRLVDRAEFVLPEFQAIADQDHALPIGHGQTISQPSTVRAMLTWLDVKPGQFVLDLGSGSGWTTALLSHLVGEFGTVTAVERIPELLKFGQDNNQRIGIENATFQLAGPVLGFPPEAPFDRILVSATVPKVPPELVEQLTVGGRMVIPVGNSVDVIEKLDKKNHISVKVHPGYVFVPLIEPEKSKKKK